MRGTLYVAKIFPTVYGYKTLMQAFFWLWHSWKLEISAVTVLFRPSKLQATGNLFIFLTDKCSIFNHKLFLDQVQKIHLAVLRMVSGKRSPSEPTSALHKSCLLV